MSDRINGFIVILDKDYKDEDVKTIISAIEQIKGVIAVTPNTTTPNEYIAKEQTKIEIANKLYDFVQQILLGEK